MSEIPNKILDWASISSVQGGVGEDPPPPLDVAAAARMVVVVPTDTYWVEWSSSVVVVGTRRHVLFISRDSTD